MVNSVVVKAMASLFGPAQGTVPAVATPFRTSGGWFTTENVNLQYCFRPGEPNVASHMAALPSSFLMPATVLASMVRGRISADHLCAGLYISQKAVRALTGTGGAACSAFSASDFDDAVVTGPEQEVRERTATS